MNIVCPYCLATLKTSDIRYCCSRCGEEKPKAFLSMFSGGGSRCKTDGCLGQYDVLKCGKCNATLPADILQYSIYSRFAVVSPSGGGKTVFITTMLEEFRNNLALRLNLNALDRNTSVYHARNRKQLYENRQIIGSTTAGNVYPMQYKIQNMRNMTKNKIPSYSLTIFDGAGEDQQNIDPVICRYISGAKMILLLLDPTQLYGVRKQMTPDEILKSGGNPQLQISPRETSDFILGIISYLRKACHLMPSAKIDIPVAVVFAKMDSVARNLGHALLLEPSLHAQRGAFIQSEADTVHREIEGWMQNCGDNLTQIFNKNFKQWRYFGVSSFGTLPQSSDSIYEPTPLRVLDPLIWNLALEGIVPTVDNE